MRAAAGLGRAITRGIALAAACAVTACSAAACSGSTAPAGTAPGAGTGASTAPAAAGTGTGTGTGTGGQDSGGRHPAADWPAFNQNAARTGVAAGLRPAGQLSRAWTARLDGAVYGQPLVVGDMVIAATENDSVYALARATGETVWRTRVGTPVPRQDLHGCGSIFPLGITGTPVYDRGTGLVYAVAETTGYHHVLVGLSVRDGAVLVRRGLDIASPANQPAYNQQRPALTISGGRIYAAFGGLAGDCGRYLGSVVGVALSGRGPLLSWHTPTARQGGIWGTGGPVAGPGGTLWVAIGNGAARRGQPYDGSDSVTVLSQDLRRVGYFAPATWADDNAADLDLGSTQPVLAAGKSAFIMGKRGVGYLLSATRPGGIGGELASLPICRAFGSGSVSGSTVYEPCQGGGMAAISVSAERREIRVLWRGPADANGSPVVGGGAVWVTAYGSGAGMLYELSQSTGAVQGLLALGEPLPHFSSLSLAGGSAYVGTMTGVVAVSGA